MLIVEVDLVKQKSIVGQRQIYAHFAHAQHKLPKLERTIKVFIKPSECLCEASILLDDPIVHMLKKHVDAAVLSGCLHHGQLLERLYEVS